MAGTFGAMVLSLSWACGRENTGFYPIRSIYLGIHHYNFSFKRTVMTVLFSLFGFFFWIFRDYTKAVRRIFFLSLVLLHIVMKAPIWHLISRIDIAGVLQDITIQVD
jgi:hypothetical protein